MSSSSWWPRRIQGLYYVATGLWPVVDPRHYMAATGQQSHARVAQGLGAAVAVVGAALVLDLIPSDIARWVGVGTAAALGAGAAAFAVQGKGVAVNVADLAMQVAFAGSGLASRR